MPGPPLTDHRAMHPEFTIGFGGIAHELCTCDSHGTENDAARAARLAFSNTLSAIFVFKCLHLKKGVYFR